MLTRCLLIIALSLLSSPALADWQFSRWGMSQQQFEAAAKKQKDVSGVAAKEKTVEFVFDADKMKMKGTAFFGDAGLSSIWLRGEGADCYTVKTGLNNKYGRPDADLGGVYKWMNRPTGDITFSDMSCSLSYKRPSKVTNKL